MLGWLVRLFLALSGSIASWFVAHDALKFPIIQMVIAVLLFTLLVAVAAFWPILKDWFKRIVKKTRN